MQYATQKLFYNGDAQASTSGKTFTTIDPSTAQPVATIHTASEKDVDAAIASGRAAFRSWSQTPPLVRSRILLKAVSLLRERNDRIAEVETHDTGKPFSETSTVDVVTGADVLEYFANLVASGGLNGETTQLRPDAWIYTKKEALGVYAEAGLPPGVFNVVHGDGAVGGYLTQHPGIAKVSFTGQVSTGAKVAASAAGGMKYVTMELGGKSPCIILPDADLENAVDGAMMANFFSTGQVVDKATLLYGGPTKPFSIPKGYENGLWVQPTVFTDCTDDMKITTEEIFGPVLCILYYDTVDEVVKRANNTKMGLAAGVFGKDINQCHDVISKLEAGITWINTWGESPAEMSVGGWKLSGVGVENGRRGLSAWVREKSTLVEGGGI
ncbi:putative Betaine aldehyde dehydrogenase [Glarea lozoyensis 74030]|uniref:aldehyde dehydrogenase (NAD(+)) n=1 Tax=Glarea lozoyensis (strain ATCC 74030 / MF5533) TaxID=1104152 RepID=H0ED23_GLAL7|nr:putative Betaine aldehyde dehydrogenase [Glarea lozoyensis 74030]